MISRIFIEAKSLNDRKRATPKWRTVFIQAKPVGYMTFHCTVSTYGEFDISWRNGGVSIPCETARHRNLNSISRCCI